MKISEKVELLSPAGNEEGFYGAIHAGADAVYLAGEKFGARAYADNFTTESLVECIRYGHLLGRRIYLTVNTLLKETEIDSLYEYLLPFYEAGLDAVIVQDLGVLRLVRENFPGLKIHVSTQMTLCGSYGAALLKDMGADRIVPARELGLQELISMGREADIEIEAFIHGAMCYCYSGQCLFSSILGGRSGNRGRCAQPCRLPYHVGTDGGWGAECYPLSLKDMCTIRHIPKLVEAEIDSFKIEGRMKKPEYTAGVTAIYRHYIDRYLELRAQRGPEAAAEAYHVEKADQERLNSLYIRSGVQDGYYFRRSGREMITLESPAYRGNDDKILAEIREKYIAEKARLPVRVKAVFRVGHPAEVTYSWGELDSTVTGEAVERAGKQPVTQENIRRQLSRLGDSAFRVSEMEIEADKDCFYPLKRMNEMRRAAVSGLEEQILAVRCGGRQGGEQAARQDSPLPEEHGERRTGYAVSVTTLPQLEAAAGWFSSEKADGPLRFYIEGDLFLRERSRVQALCHELPEDSRIFLALPYILRESDRDYLESLAAAKEESGIFQGFLARSMDGLGFVRDLRKRQAYGRKKLSCRTDAGIYAWNRGAVGALLALRDADGPDGTPETFLAEGFCLPYELRTKEQNVLWGCGACEKIVYGRIPMMITANCLLRTMGKCRKGDSLRHAALKDRYRSEFPVTANCLHCINIIYNSVPLSLHQSYLKWRERADLRLDFTLETPEEVTDILDVFLRGASFPQKEYTTGHEKRGVE